MALLHCFVPRHFTVGYHRRHWGGTTEPSYARATAAGAFLHSPANLRTLHPLFVANRRFFRARLGSLRPRSRPRGPQAQGRRPARKVAWATELQGLTARMPANTTSQEDASPGPSPDFSATWRQPARPSGVGATMQRSQHSAVRDCLLAHCIIGSRHCMD